MGTPLRKFQRDRTEPMPERVGRRIVRERSGGLCELAIPGVCLGRAAGVHHRVKRGQGGRWNPSNLLDACGSGTTGCHGWAESHPTDAQALGISLLSGDEPAREPVTMRWFGQRSVYLLEDDGVLVWQGEDYVDVSWATGADTRPALPWPGTNPEAE